LRSAAAGPLPGALSDVSAPRLLSVVILTHQEEANLGFCLASLRGLDSDIYVVDSGSTDATIAIAEQAGAHAVSHPFENHAHQLNWALKTLPIATAWVMRLDADERLTPELVTELNALLPTAPAEVTGLMVKRRVYFWGRWIRHGGYYPTWLLRVWRRGQARCEPVWMDEHMVLDGDRTLRLEHDLIDENRKGLGFWTDKHNRYADREVKDILARESAAKAAGTLDGQAGRRRWMKQNLYLRSPRFLRALLYWLYRYVILLGFLDGRPGLVFHFLQGFWYRFLVDAKLEEIERDAPANAEETGRHISRAASKTR
jgi:glycosyltransferase involved in cell wall biosynthesis